MTTDITTNARDEQRAGAAPTPRTATAPGTLTVPIDQTLAMGRDTNRLHKGSVLDTILGREY